MKIFYKIVQTVDDYNTIGAQASKEIRPFTLSIGVWRKKTKALLSDLGLGYSYIDYDKQKSS